MLLSAVSGAAAGQLGIAPIATLERFVVHCPGLIVVAEPSGGPRHWELLKLLLCDTKVFSSGRDF